MLGSILTGHGTFATGVKGAIEMVAGPQTDFEVVAFLEEESIEQFEEKMKKAIATLMEKTDGVIIFSDLLGGTPFRTAMLAASQIQNVEVIAGVNLPMLIENTILRVNGEDAQLLAEELVSFGRTGLLRAQLLVNDKEDIGEEEGI